jgi:hypothetical protein
MIYVYFISYVITGGQFAFGNFEIVRHQPVESIGDLNEIRDDVESRAGFTLESMIILNYQLLRMERV